MRLTLSRGGRRTWATVVVIASLVGGGLALADAVRPFDEFGQSGCDQIARRISDTTNLPFERLRQRCLEQTANTTQVSLDLGIYLVIAGGAIGALGGALGFVWAGRPAKPGTADPLEQAPSSESE